MLNLKVWRDKAKGLADLLEYAALIEDGIVTTKSGALLAAWCYEGRDMTSASATEKNQLSVHVNSCLGILGNGWMTHHDAIRVEVEAYFPEQAWPDPISELIDAERRERFESQGRHYETLQVLTVSYLPPVTQSSRLGQWIYGESSDRQSIADRELEKFQATLQELEGRLSAYYRLTRLRALKGPGVQGRERVYDEFLAYLQWVITGERHRVMLPPCPMYLDAVIGGQDFVGGTVPRVGEYSHPRDRHRRFSPGEPRRDPGGPGQPADPLSLVHPLHLPGPLGGGCGAGALPQEVGAEASARSATRSSAPTPARSTWTPSRWRPMWSTPRRTPRRAWCAYGYYTGNIVVMDKDEARASE